MQHHHTQPTNGLDLHTTKAYADSVVLISMKGDSEMTTKHTHQLVFGRRVSGCARCAELDAGAAPIVWRKRDADDERVRRDIRAHFDSEAHRSGKCGPVCTFGDW